MLNLKISPFIIQDLFLIFLPLGVAYNGVDQIQVEGKQVLVIGCGAIGLFAMAVSKAKGNRLSISTTVVGSEMHYGKLNSNIACVNQCVIYRSD